MDTEQEHSMDTKHVQVEAELTTITTRLKNISNSLNSNHKRLNTLVYADKIDTDKIDKIKHKIKTLELEQKELRLRRAFLKSRIYTTLDDFIHAGWPVIPLASKFITRDKRGKKKFVPIKGWDAVQQPYTKLGHSCGATVTGLDNSITYKDTEHSSYIVVIDCDSTESAELISDLNNSIFTGSSSSSLAKEYSEPSEPNNVAYSLGKLDDDGNEVKGASFFYQVKQGSDNSDLPLTFNNGAMHMEFFNGGSARMVLLPTTNNQSKVAWHTVPHVTELPELSKSLVSLLSHWSALAINSNTLAKTTNIDAGGTVATDTVVGADAITSTHSTKSTYKLFPLVVQALGMMRSNGLIDTGLLKMLTPHKYRSLPSYREKGYAHPNDIPAGQGSDYLVRVSAILGADISIDETNYASTIRYINALWSTPMSGDRLDREVIDPMITGNSSIAGEPIWCYDENWNISDLTFVTHINDLVEVFIDPRTDVVYELNHTSEIITTHAKLHTLAQMLSVKAKSRKLPAATPKLLKLLPQFLAITEPNKPFGIDRTEYNLFRPSEFLQILQDPSSHISYREPTTFIRFMESLVPDDEARYYLLRHFANKCKTFDYSPVIYYFTGVPGSGKNLFVSILSDILGKSYCSTDLGAEHITQQFNKWLDDKFICHFDELYDSLPGNMRDKVNGEIKRYTGSQTVSIRAMNTDHREAKMRATFIFTQNGDNLHMDASDRRYLLLETPNKLPQHIASDLVGHERKEHLRNIAAYLGKLQPMTTEEYIAPPNTEQKQLLLVQAAPPLVQVSRCITTGNLDYLYSLAIDAGVEEELVSLADRGVIPTDVLLEVLIALGYYVNDYDYSLKYVRRYMRKNLPNQPDYPWITIKSQHTHTLTIQGITEWALSRQFIEATTTTEEDTLASLEEFILDESVTPDEKLGLYKAEITRLSKGKHKGNADYTTKVEQLIKDYKHKIKEISLELEIAELRSRL